MARKSSNARHVMNMVIMHLNSLREKINIMEDSDQEDLETDESDQSRSEDELGFLVFKEDDLEKEISEESALIS